MKALKKLAILAAVSALTLTGSTVALAETESTLDDLFGKEIIQEEDDRTWAVQYVIDGYRFTCPKDCSVIYFDEVGPTVYVADSFQMKTVVRPKGYDEILQDKEAMTEKAVAAGGVINKEVTETEQNGRKIAYYRMDLLGDDQIVMYSPGPTEDICLAGQLVVQNPNLTEEDALKVFAAVADSAEATDAPNSTREDIDEQNYATRPYGIKKEESTLAFGNDKITFRVEEDFYSDFVTDCDLYASESFLRQSDYTTADLFLYENDMDYGKAKGYIEYQAAYYGEKGEVVVQTMEVDGVEFVGFAVSYPSEEDIMHRVFAACDLPNGGMYLIEGVRIDSEGGALTLNDFEAFMEIKNE